MKIKMEHLRQIIRDVITEAAAEGQFQKHARGTFASMIKKVSSGKNKNTSPFTEDPHMGKSAPPGQGDQ